jgi:putative transposase of IS4/5 family DUF4096
MGMPEDLRMLEAAQKHEQVEIACSHEQHSSPGQQWVFIRPYLPPPACTGRPRADDRWTIEGILYVLITGCRWQDLPHLAGEYEQV